MRFGSFQTRMLTSVIAMDFAKGEDYMSAVMAKTMSDGTVLFQVPTRGQIKSWGLFDMLHWPHTPQRSERKRHHKAKAQPNCGPRGNNPW